MSNFLRLTQRDLVSVLRMADIPSEREKLGHRLREARKARNLDAKAVADRFDLQVKRFYHWETGHALPDPITLGKLANLYEVSTDHIISGRNFKLFSDELGQKMQLLTPREIRKVENIVRAHLEMEPLAPEPVEGKAWAT